MGVLDLSLSMLATVMEPDRLTRAKRKIRDLLAERQASLTALLTQPLGSQAIFLRLFNGFTETLGAYRRSHKNFRYPLHCISCDQSQPIRVI